MREVTARSPWPHGVVSRAPLFLLGAAALVALLVVWHTLSQDFALSIPVAGLFAAMQAIPIVLAVRWPLPAWTASCVALIATAVVVGSTGGADGLWPDPNLYVHLAVMFVAGTRVRLAALAVMWSTIVGLSVISALVGLATPGTPGLTDTIALATVTVVGCGGVGARDQAVRELARERLHAALLGERNRIARELHDVVAHHMSVIAIQAEAAPLRVEDPPLALRDAFAAIRSNAVGGLTELRRVVGVLRGQDHDALQPQPQPQLSDLDDLAANVRAAGVHLDVAVDGTSRRLAPSVELSAFRIVQEALNNAMRHAPGAAVHLRVVYASDALEMVVSNEATRSSPTAAVGDGHGILGMHERVSMVGGRLDVGPTPGGGFAVTAVLPTNDQPLP